jgi:hypothetical protein
MSEPITTQDLTLSIKNTAGVSLTVEPGYALLVTLSTDTSQNVLSITPSHLDGTSIEMDVSWASNAPAVAKQSLSTTTGSTSNTIDLVAAGTATIQVIIGEGTKNQQSASLTIVVAPGVLIFGPDGNYYHMEASVWQAAPLAQSQVDNLAPSLTEMIEGGGVLFTSVAPGGPTTSVTCYVINLASMSNYLVAGLQLSDGTKR